MGTIVKKIADLEYNELLTLALIDKDEDLSEMFKEDINLPFSVLQRMSKDDSLTSDIKELILSFFENLIMTKQEYVRKYSRLLSEGIPIPEQTPIIESIPEIDTKVETKSIIKKEKKPLVPRRYGKVEIQKDIATQGGKATNAQLTALALNTMKNIYVNVNTRLVKDMHLETPILTDEDYRDIRSTVRIMENKLKKLLKKK